VEAVVVARTAAGDGADDSLEAAAGAGEAKEAARLVWQGGACNLRVA